MATRQRGTTRFDHGAQFFTVRHARFKGAVDDWIARGLVKAWFSDERRTRYCGTAGMAGIAEALASSLDVRFDTAIRQALRCGSGWRALTYTGEEFRADALLLTAPVPQSLEMLSKKEDLGEGYQALLHVDYDPCLALMARLPSQSSVPPPGYIRFDDGPIAVIGDNSQKGLSDGPADVTIHSAASFARSSAGLNDSEVAAQLMEAAMPWLGSAPLSWELHRWRFSSPLTTYTERCFFRTTPAPVALAGDAFGGPRIEGAYLSGLAAAARFLSLG